LKTTPKLETIGIGTRVLLNGAEGFVTGSGTRSSPDNPNLIGFADMHDMCPEYMGSFATSAGPEIINTWAVPIPILHEEMLENILKLDREIPLKLVDLAGRIPLCEITYGDVWDNTDLNIKYEPEKCINCRDCCMLEACPMGAVSKTELYTVRKFALTADSASQGVKGKLSLQTWIQSNVQLAAT